jgi:hypothetical protein
MAEYDLVCDTCHLSLGPEEAVVSWTTRDGTESGFALTHAGHVPSDATDRIEGRHVVWPNGYLRFFGDRIGARIAEPEPLRAILSALAPFVMRPDNPVEMDSMRAASFGQRLGVKPGTKAAPIAAPTHQEEAGK